MAVSQGLCAEGEEERGGKVIPSEGVTVQLARALRRPFLVGHRSPKTLMGHSCSPRNGSTTSWSP